MTATAPLCTCCSRPCRALKTRPGRYERDSSGWCGPCHDRWRKAGKPAGGPPPPERYGATVRALLAAQCAGRTAQARQMAAQGSPRPVIAARLGVAPRTLRRYLRSEPPVEGTAMPRTITADTMPAAAGTREPAGPGAAPEVTEWNWHPVGDGQREAINRAVEQARARDASVVSMGR